MQPVCLNNGVKAVYFLRSLLIDGAFSVSISNGQEKTVMQKKIYKQISGFVISATKLADSTKQILAFGSLFKSAINIKRQIMKIRTTILAIVAGVLGCQVCLAQSISQSDLYNFVRTTWNVSSLSDSAIQQLLNQAPSDITYNGIPYENLIGAMIESPRIIDDLNAGNYGAAGKVVLDYAQDQLFDATMEELGVASIAFPVEAAEWPISASLDAFANAVKQDAFNRQCRLYFAARKYNSADAIINAGPSALLDADQSVVQQGLLTTTDDGWLYTSQGAYAPETVPGYTSAQFYQFAETLYQVWINRNSYTGDQSNLRQAFLADAFPQAATIYQQPNGGSYTQGGSFLLSVGASGQQPLQYQWLLNGVAITGANNSTYRVQSPNTGSYSVNVTDNNSLTTASESVTVDMLPTGNTVAISAPANNATLSGSTTVRVTAPTATSVGFYLDGLLQITDTSSPFSWTWNTATADGGQHSLTAKAYNSSTLIGTSAAIQVTLNNPNSGSSPDTNEPNNSSLTATLLTLGSTDTGYIGSPSDVDWFKIQVTNSGTLTVMLTVPTTNDFDLELYGPDASWVAGSYNPVGQNEQINYTVTQAGTYYARTYGYPYGNGSFNTNQSYQISASLGAPIISGTNSGPITQNITWSGVVYLSGDVTIGPGVALTILPGTLIQCQPNTDTQAGGANSSRVEIILNGGTINAIGTPNAPIVFTSAGPNKTPGDWYGIRVVTGDVTLNNCVVEYATEGVRFEDSDTRFSNYALNNVTVQRCSGDGVWMTSGQYASVTLNNFQVWTNQTGISDNGTVTLVGGQVVGNSANGINGGTLVATGTTVSQNGGVGISGGPVTLNGCVITRNKSTGVGGTWGSLTGCSITFNQGDAVSTAAAPLQMSGCTLANNNGWGLNGNWGNSGSWTAAVWNNVVQSNSSGGLAFNYFVTVGVVSNTITGNGGPGLDLNMYNNYGNVGESASGITGNVIYNNSGVGVEYSGNAPSVLTISGNDIYQNTTFDLRNDSGNVVIANGNYWGSSTGTELSQGQKNLSRIYDILDGGSADVVIDNWYAAPFSGGNPGPLQNFVYTYPGVSQVVSGTISTAQNWSGTVLVVGDVTVSGSLTIAPGTTVLFDALHDNQTSGSDRSRSELIINGSLNAAGTSGSPILFTSAAQTKTPGDWYGIRVVTGDVTLNNCVVEYATEGVRFEDSDTRFSNYALNNVTVQRCSGDGVWMTSGQYASVTLNNFQVWTNQTGISDNGTVTLVGGQVVGNSANGINGGTLVATGTTVSQNGGVGISGGPVTLNGCVITRNKSTGVGGTWGSLTGCSITFNQGDAVSTAAAPLQMSGCTLANNNGWGLNGNWGNSGSWTAAVWNNVVQSNSSGGLAFNYFVTVGVVSNTITGNGGPGLDLNMYNNYGNVGESASGITGNVIYNNSGVGVEYSGNAPSVLTISGNDIYQNTTFDLRNDSGNVVIANGNYWGSSTGTELSQGQKNLSRIYDILDGGSADVVIDNWYAAPFSGGNPGPLQNFVYTYPGVSQVVSGTISTAQNWSGTVLVVGDVTVSGSLTIAPGTTVLFDALHDNQTSGSDRSRSELIINGSLNAAGTSGSPILFTSAAQTKTPGDWYGIRVVTGDVTLNNCVVEYATEGVRFEDSDTRFSNYALNNVTVQRCSGDGVWMTSGQYASVTLNNFQVWTNQTGISDNGTVTLVGGQVVGNSANGINGGTLVATGTTVSQNGGVGISGGPVTLNGCVITRNKSTGVGGTWGSLTGCSITFNQGDAVSTAAAPLQMSGCTLANNNGWGLNGNWGNSGSWTAAVWNNVVQSNSSGGLAFNYFVTVGVVSNTITGNGGPGLDLNMYNNYGNVGESASGITGNVIYNNSGVGVEYSGNAPSVLTISGNDIYQNTTFDLRNDSGNTIIATNEYWGEPTTSEVNAGQVNLSRIYDSHDNAGVGQVLVQGIRGASTQTTLHFTQQPQSVMANIGDTVTLSPLVSGTGPISYQWFDNGLPMAQATNLSLTLANVNVGNSGGYYLVISNATGMATSSPAYVAVILPSGAPAISQQPQSQSVLAGAAVSFTVVAAGTGPFGYQWQKDSVAINGATSPTYTIHAVVVNDTGAYSVIVTNSGGSISSQAATLTVNVLSGSAINRTITTNGGNFSVSLIVAPPAGTPAYMVEEVLPIGFVPSNISSSGSWDATSRTITWGPFFDGLPRSFTYTLIPPSGFSGTAALTGQALLFGATATTGGDSTVSVGPPPMSPILTLVQVAPGIYGVSVAGEIGRTYRVDAADNLGSGTWTPVITVVVTQTPFTIVDLGSIGKSMRFYRAVVVQ